MNSRIFTLLRMLFLCCILCSLGACATTKVAPELTLASTGFRAPVSHAPSPEAIKYATEESYIGVDDPLNKFNRGMYAINATIDSYVLFPLATAYEAMVLPPFRAGIANGIKNLNEVPSFIHCLLQAKPKQAFSTLGRFLINSTLGIVGLFDVASAMGLERHEEDFGQTLGVWGFDDGAYVVLPLFGPSNMRDTAGRVGDYFITTYEMESLYELAAIDDKDLARKTNFGVRTVNTRATIPFRYYSTDTPFEYEFIRFLYTKKRELDVAR